MQTDNKSLSAITAKSELQQVNIPNAAIHRTVDYVSADAYSLMCVVQFDFIRIIQVPPSSSVSVLIIPDLRRIIETRYTR